ncbi:MAG: purine-nucleoside phosphorylase [Verrucomicrobiales bacterium]|nr:purine-nucleoside phosphorylase [Verrucomicrobiales bacterium]
MGDQEFHLPKSLGNHTPKIGLVLGSGLGSFVDTLDDNEQVAYSDIKGLPQSGVEGHAGKLHLGKLGGIEIAIAQGRVHLYEGWSAKETASMIRLFHQIGITTVVLTNAAGIVNANFKPGRWMLISDHLNLTRQSPLTGEATFIDQTEVYSRALREMLKSEAAEIASAYLFEGVYAWVNGPEYETPAEVRMLRGYGADAVGMSTVPEAIQARALGMRVVGLSCLTNYGAGLTGQALSHDEVIEVGRQAAGELFTLLENAVPAMVEI